MILYLTSKLYMNILDFLNEKEELLIKKYVGEFSLKEFIGKSIQRLGHIETIVIDRTCLLDTRDEIIEVVQTFKQYSQMRIVFYIPEEDEMLIHKLIELGIFNIITENDVKELREEIQMCLFEGMTERYIKNKVGLLSDESKEIPFDFKGKQITIGVVGSQHRVGTTTVAMQFACYLNSIGAKVCYVEANNSGHMKLIAEHYEMKKKGAGYVYNGIAFEDMDSDNTEVFNFVVYDMGVIDKKTVNAFVYCKIRFFCLSREPQEIRFYNRSFDLLRGIKYTTIVRSYKEEYVEKYEYSLEYGHDIMNIEINNKSLNNIFKKIFIDLE